MKSDERSAGKEALAECVCAQMSLQMLPEDRRRTDCSMMMMVMMMMMVYRSSAAGFNVRISPHY